MIGGLHMGMGSGPKGPHLWIDKLTDRLWLKALPSRKIRLLVVYMMKLIQKQPFYVMFTISFETIYCRAKPSIIRTFWDIITTMVWQERAKFALGNTMECFEYIGGLVMNGVPSVQLATFLAKIANKRADLSRHYCVSNTFMLWSEYNGETSC